MAFNRIIRGLGWPDASQGEIEFPADRVPENASDPGLALLPTLFMAEGRGRDDLARVGSVQVVGRSNSIVRLRYQYDPTVPLLTQDRLESVATEIGLSAYGTGRNRFDWTHTRWSVQDGDLYRTVLRLLLHVPSSNAPTVFNVLTPPRIDPVQASAMMPFSGGFGAVYEAIVGAAGAVGMRCNRADNIWEHHTIIQDVVSLIDRSRIVICDLTGRNPNVFYEAGISHTLGREVILITQHADDVPFDLRHIRYITYLNNAEGLAQLQRQLTDRMQTILRS
ncbi:hypothetical protein [Rhizobium rhizogenes]|uniref:hypothetical protein n=1 Tax=Rhizobium rhizogenes TaxID=359 RepID=UPI0022C270BF|nr:hypothetical protein [Rhizobium rhizogenes]MCZ7454386.1 hypothetical protein [Rhizobium rhizogenes]